MVHVGDITKLNGYELPIVDVITGGSPCQNLSIAGNRSGLSGDQSRLFIEQIRVVKEIREHDRTNRRSNVNIRPRYMVWENVLGAFSSNEGRDFQSVLTEIARIAEPECPDVPLPKNGKWGKSGCLYDELGRWSIAWRVHDAQFWGVAQRRKRISVIGDFGGLSAPEILFERKGLQWHPSESRETWEGTPTNTVDGIETASRRVVNNYPSSAIYDARGRGNGEVSPPIIGDHQRRITDYTAVCVGNGQLKQITMSDKMNTLDTMHDQQAILSYGIEPGAAQRMNTEARISPEKSPTIRANAGDNQVSVATETIVRRLTPKECERLQGFPDGYTDIGTWVDSKGKKRKSSDAIRYKALGNSIALPFWQYLARRICAQYERDITIGSLFDGIGGFPYVFKRCGATPVWASEIDEFCIAVTKYHFG